MVSNYYPFDSKRPIDLICMGRIAVDLYAEQIGSPLADAQSFRKYLGGCAANISVGTAKLGLQSAMFSCIGQDDMGQYLKSVLVKEGVDTSQLKTTDEHLTAIVLLGVDPPDRFPLIFYRENCADMQIKEEDANEAFFEKCKALLITGTGMSKPAMFASTMHAAQLAKQTGTAVILDIDYRPVLWGLTKPGDGESRYEESEKVTKVMKAILPYVDLIVGTEEEVRILTGGNSLQSDLEIIKHHTQAPLVLKTGEKGCEVYVSDLTEPIVGTPYPVEVMNVLGAGDAFMSGFLRGWLRKEPLSTCAQFGNANGAIVVSRHGCAPAMASFEELNYFIQNYQDSQILYGLEMERLHQKTELGSARDHELLVMAFDHRNQFEDDVNRLGIETHLIKEFKNQVFEGFLKVREDDSSPALSILVDPIYGKDIIRASQKRQIQYGMPVEEAGVFPVSWINDQQIYTQVLKSPSTGFIKVLWKYHADMDAITKQVQMTQLKELSLSCLELDRKLMLELIIPDDFEHNGQALTTVMDEVYQSGIYPYWWKIAAVDSQKEWDLLTAKIDQYDLSAGVVILGGGDSPDKFENWFRIAKPSQHCVGFAIGRSIFWQAWQQFSQGQINAADIPEIIKNNYVQFIQLWRNAST